MPTAIPSTALQMQSCIHANATLELSLAEVPVPEPGENEVVVRMEAAPINPSDMGMLFGPADMNTARASGSDARPVVNAEVPERLMKSVEARVDQALPCGNEGAGVVIAAGASEAAQALLGRTVAMLGGSAAMTWAWCLAELGPTQYQG